MLKLKKIAVTGTLSSGKTTVCNFLKELGACVVNADQIVHQLLSPENLIGQKVIQLLGKSVVQEGSFNRKQIAEIVFSNDEKLQALESILFPEVAKAIEERYQQACKEGGYSAFVAEVPLLFEAKMESEFDAVIHVDAEENSCRRRFLASGGTEEQFKRRMRRQMPSHKKYQLAPYHLINNNDLAELKRKTAELYQQLI
jgi:dephospho-CoA kinase